jgi:hypothetical protein
MLDAKEKHYLRELARTVKEIADRPHWDEKIDLWRHLNSLKKVRPLVLCAIPEAAWHELIPDSDLRIGDDLFSTYEWELKKRIHRWKHIGDDEIITDRLYVPIRRSLTDWVEGRARPYSGRADRSAKFSPSIVIYDDLKKLRYPELTVDHPGTESDYGQILDVFGDILDVRLGEPFHAATDNTVMGWGNSLIDILCELRGLAQLYEDLVSAPEFVKEAMDFLRRGTLRYLDDLEKEGLLQPNNNEFIHNSNTPLGSNGLGITDELPKENFDPGRVTPEHLWGYFMAQEFSEVSPDMLAEFVLPYQASIAERFGLTCYGCCEGNDRKWDLIIESLPHLRELSVSHAADLGVAAEKLGNRYVLSWKPNATTMIAIFDEDYIQRSMEEAFYITRDCCLVVSLRDTQTLFGEPDRIRSWTRITLDAAQNN